MRKLKSKLFLLISIIAVSFSSLVLSGINKTKGVVKADSLNNVGQVSIEECKVYDPFGNLNHFLMLKLSGSDYPENASAREVSKSTLQNTFTANIADATEFYSVDNKKINITDYFSVYSNQHHMSSYFSIWLSDLGSARFGVLKKEFKIPSYAVLTGDTSSVTYGYYTLDKDYEIYAEDLNYVLMTEGFHDYHFDEYNPRHAYINSVQTYVDNGHEMLTFALAGAGIDYPNTANNHFDVSEMSSILANFKSKVHLFTANGEEMNYEFEQFVLSINLWGVQGRISISILELENAKRLYVEEGLILPSEARRTNNTASAVYDGFIILNTLDLTVDSSAAHETGSRINWCVYTPTLKALSLAKVESESPWGNGNEFLILTFNEPTDFSNISASQWTANSVSLLSNLQTHVKLYNANNQEVAISIPLNSATAEAYYNYHHKSNNLTLMFAGLGNVRKIVLLEGLIIPSFALYANDHSSSTFGNYYLGLDYELTIGEGHTHTAESLNNWPLPSCSIKYYDEDGTTLLTSDSAVLGSTYRMIDVVARDGYKTSWELVSPVLTIEDNSFVVPFTVQDIVFKAKYVEIKSCRIEYYSENDNLIEELTTSVFCGENHMLSPLVSKKGYDASWVIVEPTNLQIVNNTITIPDDVELVKIKAHYEVRTYRLSFEGVVADPIYVRYNERIGTLPNIPTEPSQSAHWIIDGEIITENSLYVYDENKVATILYTDRYCVISFNTNGGDAVDDVQVLYGNTINELPIPVKEGYYFDNWYLDEELSNVFDKSNPIQDDMTFYAKCKIESTVTFYSDGGSQVESVHLGAGDKIENPLSPTKEGYEFVYWMLNGKEFDFNNPITESITLVAKWNKTSDVKPSEPKQQQSINGGQIAIIVAASVVSLAGLAFLGIMLFKKKKA